MLDRVREVIDAAREWGASWRSWRAEQEEDAPPSVEEIGQRREQLREHIRELEAARDRLGSERKAVLRGEAEGAPAELREEMERIEGELADLDVAQEGLVELHREASLRAWRRDVTEAVSGLPGLGARHRRARKRLAAVQDEIRTAVKALLQQAFQLDQRGSPVYLGDAELAELQAAVDAVPGLRADLASYLRRPPEEDLEEPKIIFTVDDEGNPVREFVGDWDEKKLAAAGGTSSHDVDGARVVHPGVTP